MGWGWASFHFLPPVPAPLLSQLVGLPERLWGGGGSGWGLSDQGGRPRLLEMSSMRCCRRQRRFLAQVRRALPGVGPAGRWGPWWGARWLRRRRQARSISCLAPEASRRARDCSWRRAMWARRGGIAASVSRVWRGVALKAPVTARRHCCRILSSGSPIHCRFAGRRVPSRGAHMVAP